MRRREQRKKKRTVISKERREEFEAKLRNINMESIELRRRKQRTNEELSIVGEESKSIVLIFKQIRKRDCTAQSRRKVGKIPPRTYVRCC